MIEVKDISLDCIRVGPRKRAISPGKVVDIQKSIEQQGLLQPIGVIRAGDGYRLVFGAHRLAAFQEANRKTIAATVFSEHMTDEECALVELQENLARNDLTGVERKAFAAEAGRISTILFAESENEDESHRDSDWMKDWRDKIGLPKNTAYTWWKSFCSETGLSITPKQAKNKDKEAFFDWLEAARDKAEKERQEKERRAEEVRERKEHLARARMLETERGDLRKYLDETTRLVGRVELVEWLYEWIEDGDDNQ